jgi:hypothetical protein
MLPDVDLVDMLFTLSDIRNNLGSILEAWCVQQEIIKPLYSLYFGTLRSPQMYVEHRFLNMFQALEAFDRRRHVPSAESQKKHDERIHRILSRSKAKRIANGWNAP